MFPKHSKPMMVLMIVCFMWGHTYALKKRVTVYGPEDPIAKEAYGSSSLLENLFVANSEGDPAAGLYRSIGDVSLSTPNCVSWGAERVDCFIRSEACNVHHWHKDNGVYYKWENLNGCIVHAVESVSRKEGYIDILVTGSDGAMWVNTFNGNWSGFKSLGGVIMEEPSCIARTSSIVDCVVRTIDNKPYAIEAIDGKWGEYEKFEDLFRWPLAASRRSDDIYDFWGIGYDSQLYHNWWDGKWHTWNPMGGRYKGRPSVVSRDVDRIDIFVLTMYNNLHHLKWIDGKYEWENLGGTLEDVPSCVNIGEDIHCFGIGPRSHLYRKSFINGEWTVWYNAYGFFIQAPSCVVSNRDDNIVSCYMRDFTDGIVELIYKF